ncbi:MAG: hypothetical protein IIW77_06145 [Bacteroidaceae bacterium]|nr:hypothetical protein [Bacteroidaceae bacterium]
MTKIKVKLEAFYGYGCCGYSYDSEEVIEVEVNDEVLKALRGFGTEEISSKAIAQAIENGETALQSLHEQLEEKCDYMVEEYWLNEAGNEDLGECLSEAIKEDIESGIYTPTILEDEDDDSDCSDCDKVEEKEENEEEGDDFWDDEDWDEDDYDGDDEIRYDMDEYYNWIREQGHGFAAERLGVDLYEACCESEMNYTIFLNNRD